jgi:AcrR family transcriptional regulator
LPGYPDGVSSSGCGKQERRRLRADAERNRVALASAAREVFAEQGLAAPLEHIAKRAGLGIATLYRNFPTRSALMDAVIADTADAHREIIRRALANEDPWTGLTGYLTEICQLASTADQAAGQTMAIAGSKVYPQLAELVARAQAAGRLRADLAPTDVLCLTVGIGRIIEVTQALDPDAWRRQLALLLDGLRPAAAHPLPHPPCEAFGARECGVDL